METLIDSYNRSQMPREKHEARRKGAQCSARGGEEKRSQGKLACIPFQLADIIWELFVIPSSNLTSICTPPSEGSTGFLGFN